MTYLPEERRIVSTEDQEDGPHVKVTLERIYERQLVQQDILAPLPRTLDQIVLRLDSGDEWRRTHELETVRTIGRVGSVEEDVKELKPRVTANEIARWKLIGYGTIGGFLVTALVALSQLTGTTQ